MEEGGMIMIGCVLGGEGKRRAWRSECFENDC